MKPKSHDRAKGGHGPNDHCGINGHGSVNAKYLTVDSLFLELRLSR